MGDLLDDILKEDTKKEDDIKEKEYIEDIKGTKNVVNNPNDANVIVFRLFYYTDRWYQKTVYLNVSNIPYDSYYKVYFNLSEGYWELPNDGYYKRGNEVVDGNYNEHISGIYYFDDSNYTTTNGVSYEIFQLVEPTPDPTPEPTLEPTPEPVYPTVSENIDYRPAMNRIIENQERIISQNELLSNELVSIGDDLSDYLNNQTVSIDSVSSNNIMYKLITDYSVSESLMLLIAMGILVGGIVVLIKRSIPRWH